MLSSEMTNLMGVTQQSVTGWPLNTEKGMVLVRDQPLNDSCLFPVLSMALLIELNLVFHIVHSFV